MTEANELELTEERKLEMTETIGRACGWANIERWGNYVTCYRSKEEEEDLNEFMFCPFVDWGDAMRAADALGAVEKIVVSRVFLGKEKAYRVGFGHGEYRGDPFDYEATHSDRLTAFVMALYEAAKAKLEEE